MIINHLFGYAKVKIVWTIDQIIRKGSNQMKCITKYDLKFNDILRMITDDIKHIRGNVIKYDDVKKILYKGNIMKK